MKAAVPHTKWVARSLTRSALQHQQQRQQKQWQAETEAERAFLFTSRTSSAAKSGNPKRAKAFITLSLSRTLCQLSAVCGRCSLALSALALSLSVCQTAVCTPCPNLLTLLRPPPLESSRLPQCNERDSCGCLHVILADIVNMTKMHVPLKRCVCESVCVCIFECLVGCKAAFDVPVPHSFAYLSAVVRF